MHSFYWTLAEFIENDLIPFAFLGACGRVDSVRVMEILDYSTYLQADVLFDIMGFGKSLDELPLILQPGVIGLAWGCPVSVLAAGLGAELDDIREVHERVPAARDYQTPLGTIAAGTTAGMRFEVQGMIGGEPVWCSSTSRASTKRSHPTGRGSRVKADTASTSKAILPSIVSSISKGEDGDHNTGGLMATAMRSLNAIPTVCEADPGLLSVLDLPLITGRGLLR